MDIFEAIIQHDHIQMTYTIIKSHLYKFKLRLIFDQKPLYPSHFLELEQNCFASCISMTFDNEDFI